MNTKLQKFYSRLFRFSKNDYLQNPETILPFFKFACEYDFDIASSLWEFIVLEHENEAVKNPAFARIISEKTLEIFYKRSELKTTRLIHTSAPVRKALYTLNPDVCQDCASIPRKMFISFLLSNKLETCDDIFKCLNKNQNIKFGALMRELLESYIQELIAKANASLKRLDLPRKISTLLLAHIAKIRGPERALLEQRIRELY